MEKNAYTGRNKVTWLALQEKSTDKKKRKSHLTNMLIILFVFGLHAISLAALHNCMADAADPGIPQEEAEIAESAVCLDVECELQLPELPNGCEITSLSIVMRYFGFHTDKMTLAHDWLASSEQSVGTVNPEYSFWGYPWKDNSYGCFAPVIKGTAESYFIMVDNLHTGEPEGFVSRNITGATPEQLYQQIENGLPVIVWVTQDLVAPSPCGTWIIEGKQFTWMSPMHCVVLTGFDRENKKVYIADPMKGNTEYDMTLFEKRFKDMGSQGVVIGRRYEITDLPMEKEYEIPNTRPWNESKQIHNVVLHAKNQTQEDDTH